MAQEQILCYNLVITTHKEPKMSITYTVTVDEDTIQWYLNGQLHRLDGPAIEFADGSKFWYLNGQLHRENGPAVEYADSTKCWCLNDQLHRLDGPAIEFADGSKFWYLNGQRVTQKEHACQTQPVLELTIADVEKLIGRSVKIIK